MNSVRKFIIRETALLTIAEAICIGAMIGVFAMLDRFSYKVVLGGVLGGLLAVGNFLFMAIAANAAADKAMENENAEEGIKTGKKAVKTSYRLRLLIVGVLLFLFAKSGHCNVLALACPLFFTFPCIAVIELFRKEGDPKNEH